jgi:hypothetical protein
MLWTLAVILFVLWGVGVMSFRAAGGFVHILLILAIAVVLFHIL